MHHNFCNSSGDFRAAEKWTMNAPMEQTTTKVDAWGRQKECQNYPKNRFPNINATINMVDLFSASETTATENAQQAFIHHGRLVQRTTLNCNFSRLEAAPGSQLAQRDGSGSVVQTLWRRMAKITPSKEEKPSMEHDSFDVEKKDGNQQWYFIKLMNNK